MQEKKKEGWNVGKKEGRQGKERDKEKEGNGGSNGLKKDNPASCTSPPFPSIRPPFLCLFPFILSSFFHVVGATAPSLGHFQLTG